MTDPGQMAGSGRRYRPNTTRTTVVLMSYLSVTTIFDLFIYLTLHGRGVGHLALFTGVADFMSEFVPAIDGTRDYLESKGHTALVAPYRDLIAVNWILFVLFVLAITPVLAREVYRQKDEFFSWIESGYRIRINSLGRGLIAELVELAFSDPLGKTRIFIVLILGGGLAMLYTDFLSADSRAFYFPGLECFVIWAAWLFCAFVWVDLTQFSVLAFCKSTLNRRTKK
jgi:hypothetical protein